MKVKDAMHKGTVWVGPNATLPELAKKMRDNDIGALPVGENDRLIGLLSLGDVSQSAAREDVAEMAQAVSAHHG